MYSVMQVTQQSLSVHGMLRSVEDVIKGVVFEEGQSSLYDGLRALVATTWKFHLLACRALRVRGRRIPQPGTVDVVIAAHVHEVGRSIGQHHGPDTTLLRMHAERSLITETMAGRVTLCDASARPIHIITETTVVHEGVQIAGRGSNIVSRQAGLLLASPGGMAIRGTPRCCPPSPTCLRRRKGLCRVVDTLVASGHHVTRGLVQGEGCRRKVGETDARGRRTRVGPSGAEHGGWWLTPPGNVGPGVRPRTARDLADGRVSGALRNEAPISRRSGQSDGWEAGDRTLPTGGRGARSLPRRWPSRTNTKVVKLTVDKWFVDKDFGFGKVQIGEVVFIYASVVQGAEVLVVGTDAWMQVLSDHARVERGTEAERFGATERGRANRVAQQARRAATLTAELAVQSENQVFDVCSQPPGLHDEPAAERSQR